jgi:hypothetical protein
MSTTGSALLGGVVSSFSPVALCGLQELRHEEHGPYEGCHEEEDRRVARGEVARAEEAHR